MRDSGCKGCTERKVGCHSQCEKNAKYKAQMEQINKYRRNEKLRDSMEIHRIVNVARTHALKQQARRAYT